MDKFQYSDISSPTSDGSAAAILASEDFVHKHGLEGQAVEILAMEMATDVPSAFQKSSMQLVGYDMSKNAAEKVFQKAGKCWYVEWLDV